MLLNDLRCPTFSLDESLLFVNIISIHLPTFIAMRIEILYYVWFVEGS